MRFIRYQAISIFVWETTSELVFRASLSLSLRFASLGSSDTHSYIRTAPYSGRSLYVTDAGRRGVDVFLISPGGTDRSPRDGGTSAVTKFRVHSRQTLVRTRIREGENSSDDESNETTDEEIKAKMLQKRKKERKVAGSALISRGSRAFLPSQIARNRRVVSNS